MQLTNDQEIMLDALPDATAVVDPSGVIFAVNRSWKTFCANNGGNSECFYLGRNYFRVCETASGKSRALSATFGHGLAEVLDRRDEFRCEYPCHSPSEKRWFEAIVRPVDLSGKRCAIVMHRNITSRKLQQREIDASRELANELAALVATSTDAIISFDLEGRVITWNHAAEEMYGYGREEIVGKTMEMLYPSDWPRTIDQYIDDIIAGELIHFEVVRRTKNGVLRNIAVSAAPVRNSAGEVIAISNIHRDVTAEKEQAERQRYVTGELTHRTKNMLAVISAIERQTASRATSVDDFHERLSARFAALLASNNLLVASDWGSVSLDELARRQLSAFLDTEARNILIEGPAILLRPAAVQSLGMSFHELATNTLKYGKLASGESRLRLGWSILLKGGEASLRIDWQETGASVGDCSGGKGFGHAVLTSLARQSLNADVDYALGCHGVSWSIEIPAAFFVVQE